MRYIEFFSLNTSKTQYRSDISSVNNQHSTKQQQRHINRILCDIVHINNNREQIMLAAAVLFVVFFLLLCSMQLYMFVERVSLSMLYAFALHTRPSVCAWYSNTYIHCKGGAKNFKRATSKEA